MRCGSTDLMTTKDRITNLADRTHRLELLDELDRQAAKSERETRMAAKRRIDAEHHTIRVTQGDQFAEPINDPPEWHRFVAAAEGEELYPATKWHNLLHAGVLYCFRGEWRVRVAAAEMGYDVVEVRGKT